MAFHPWNASMGLMRHLLLLVVASILSAGEAAAVPPAVQKLIDASVEVAQKSHDAYLAAVKKEQDKLVSALLKEQEKATKKGDLEVALAIKAKIDAVQGGLLRTESAKSTDLLGDAVAGSPAAAAAANVPASLASDCQVGPEVGIPENAPKELEAVLRRASRIALPKGDRTRYTFTCTAAGTVVVSTGPGHRPHAELWADLQKAGFRRLESEGAWWVLDAKPGQQFQIYDPPMAGAATAVYALRFTRAR